MTTLLLLLILVALIAVNVQLRQLINTDFTNEDAQVKATTERIRKAKERLPQQEK